MTAENHRSKFKPDPDFDAARDNAYEVTAAELTQFVRALRAVGQGKRARSRTIRKRFSPKPNNVDMM